MERILLSPSEWWIGKKDGKLLAMMFGRRGKDGAINVEWEVLDESNLPVDLVRCDGVEYTFLLPVSIDGRTAIQEVTASLGGNTPERTANTGPGASGTLANFDSVPLAGGICGGEVASDGPVAGSSGHGNCGSENSSTNVKVSAPARKEGE